MDKQEVLDVMAQEAAKLAREQARAVVAGITADELRPLVESQIRLITDPLQEEISRTDSPWVKIRDTVYIRLINSAIDIIVSSIASGLKSAAEQ